jgi:hypothetical protein
MSAGPDPLANRLRKTAVPTKPLAPVNKILPGAVM